MQVSDYNNCEIVDEASLVQRSKPCETTTTTTTTEPTTTTTTESTTTTTTDPGTTTTVAPLSASISAVAPTTTISVPTAPSQELAFTGAHDGLLLVFGTLTLAVGVGLRRLARR